METGVETFVETGCGIQLVETCVETVWKRRCTVPKHLVTWCSRCGNGVETRDAVSTRVETSVWKRCGNGVETVSTPFLYNLRLGVETVSKRCRNGMETVWKRCRNGVSRILDWTRLIHVWKRCGNMSEAVWKRCGNGVETVWKRTRVRTLVLVVVISCFQMGVICPS